MQASSHFKLRPLAALFAAMLSGSAWAAPAITLSSADGFYTSGTQTIDFGNRTISALSRTVTLTLTNSGDADLTLGAAALTLAGTNPSDFSIADSTCANAQVIAAASACNIVVTFTPSALAARSATIAIASDAASAPINLAGTGVAASTAPAPVQAGYNDGYNAVNIYFAGVLEGVGAIGMPDASAFAVSVNGGVPAAASGIDIVDGKLEIWLGYSVTVC